MHPLIPHNPTHDINDSSKITEFMDCPRKYFYRYVLGWRLDQPELHLAFGTAWHAAMEVLLQKGYSATNEAFAAFMEAYRKEVPIEIESLEKKNPDSAMRAIKEYSAYYANDRFETIYIEISGKVTVGHNENGIERFINFRMDNILRDENRMYLYLDHKTGSRLDRAWRDQWVNSFQMSTYLHVLHCIYPNNEIWGGKVNGVFFKAKEIEFERVPVRKDAAMMAEYLAIANYWLDLLDHHRSLLAEAKESDPVMVAYPKNPQSCTKYFGCPYIGLCSSRANPLQTVDMMPTNMKVEYWDPSKADKTTTTINYVDGQLEVAINKENNDAPTAS